jgi:cis-3-alkyl-4-acyloxetan-2-one decarboxylase
MLNSSLYPFESHWLEFEKYRYHYLDEGDKSHSPVVMLHGNPSWSFLYRNLIPELRNTNRVIVPDHIGMGLSDKPEKYPYILSRHIDNLEILIDHLGLKDISLVLHDWGGIIGMGYAIRHPENVKRFIVLNTAAFYLPAIPLSLKIARSPFIGDIFVRGLNGFAIGALILGIVHHERITPQIKQGYLQPYDTWAKRVSILRFIQDIPLEKNHPSRETLLEIDRKIEVFKSHPMMIAWGDKDPVFTTKYFLSEWRRRFPQAEVHLFEDAGHYVLEDAYERILPLAKNFLNPAV